MSRESIPKPIQLLGTILSSVVNTAHNEIFIRGRHKPNKHKYQHKYEKNYYIVHHHWNCPKKK